MRLTVGQELDRLNELNTPESAPQALGIVEALLARLVRAGRSKRGCLAASQTIAAKWSPARSGRKEFDAALEKAFVGGVGNREPRLNYLMAHVLRWSGAAPRIATHGEWEESAGTRPATVGT